MARLKGPGPSPAPTDLWICPRFNGRIQVVGAPPTGPVPVPPGLPGPPGGGQARPRPGRRRPWP
ncbi:hypothetical protein ABZ761_20845 [Kitasatospora sp. NPDC006786]|uniref:hypothetical protein n=1 Tax=Kitasatospora sp. NPDC006786 TaxID=3157187 RepID=UPI0033D6D7AD